jgi:hypothetical protein
MPARVLMPQPVGLRRVELVIRHRDGGHLDKPAVVFRFDLEDVADGDDFPGLFVGAAAKSGNCTEGADEDEHGFSLSG